MYRALTLSRSGARHPVPLLGIKQFRPARTFTKSSVLANAVSSTSPTPKKRGFLRTVTLYSTGLVILFYSASPVVAVNNERYNAFFVESVPFGEVIMNLIEDQGLDEKLRFSIIKSVQDIMQQVFDNVSKKASDALPAAEKTDKVKENVVERVSSAKSFASERVEKAREKIQEKTKDAKERAQHVVSELRTKTEKRIAKASGKASELAKPVEEKVLLVVRPEKFSEGVEELVQRVEGALAGKIIEIPSEVIITPEQPISTPRDTVSNDTSASESSSVFISAEKNIYSAELPIGFEPPPGFQRPGQPPRSTSAPKSDSQKDDILPLLAPIITNINASEPVIAELASTIDSLASFIKENPSAATSAKGILDTAKSDLQLLASRIDEARNEERSKLEEQLQNQAREYMLKLLELEVSAQDKLDEQELEFKHFFEEERNRMIQAYREKLEHELQTQSEIINERLKAEVIAQGIEMQRRWIREIKVRVEQERGGRLGKLEELAANIKQLERITKDNADYLDENLRLHATWAAFRALVTASSEASVRRPFRDELRVLRHASGAREDELTRVVLDTLEASDVPDVGVEPLADLTSWFTTSVAPQVARVALVPEYDAGVLSYLTSHFFSSFRFQRKGFVEGNDVLSVLARAEYYMNENDLDSATRELNQLKGAPKVLLSDWLDAARKRLEVLQALEVIQSQTTLASLRIV